jgi:hypothetical protein
MTRPPVNDAQRQLADQSAANLAAEGAAAAPDGPTEQEIADGRFAYAAYATPEGAGDKTWDDRPMPTWDEMGDRQRAGWIAVGRAFARR